MLTKIDHIGIAVESIEASSEIYQTLGLDLEAIEEVPDQGVRVAFFQIGEVAIELLEPTSDESPIAKFLQKRGPGIHHIAYASDNLEEDLSSLKEKGVQLIDEAPRKGAHDSLIAFLHPKSTGKVLTELCQKPVQA